MALDDLWAKISSYNIFNYLLPGILFAAFVQPIAGYKIDQPNLLLAVFVYYFIGMVISRIGSLIVEPVLKKIGFLNFADYGDFVRASAKDAKIETLSEANNTYRTLIALFICLALTWAYRTFEHIFPAIGSWTPYLIAGTIFLLFLFSYRKQAAYITKRIDAHKGK